MRCRGFKCLSLPFSCNHWCVVIRVACEGRWLGTCLGLSDREASLIKKEFCKCGPHPLQVISSRAGSPLVKGAGCIGPLFPDFRSLATLVHGLHCTAGTPKTLHWRLFLAPHCTLRLSHLSVGGSTRRLEIVGQLDM